MKLRVFGPSPKVPIEAFVDSKKIDEVLKIIMPNLTGEKIILTSTPTNENGYFWKSNEAN